MTQIHGIQHGTFHITTNTRGKVPWCTYEGIPQILIDNLVMTRNVCKAELYAFCILPDHMHILLNPGEKGLSAFMHSFKKNSSRDIQTVLGSGFRTAAAEKNIPPIIADHTNRLSRGDGSKTTEGNIRSRSGDSKIAAASQKIKWHKGYHDERIRDAEQRSTVLGYIQGNAMKHELVNNVLDWPWTSLHFPNLLDPMEIWLD